ncbi:MAG: gmr 10 [Hyphomicrobiales bacterium]|nr:gmr 10 [Hyphomicrobiales bacterium]
MHDDLAAATHADLADQVRAQAGVIRAQAAALAHSITIFERAASVAKIGVWECSLASQALNWTNGVYDMFELPRGALVTRAQTLQFYSDASRQELERVRTQAIKDQSGFTLDAQITTAAGTCRWIRLTASVESEDGVAVRIFGMKQDITAEKALSDQTRLMAECDVLTGLANRSVFQSKLAGLRRPEGSVAGAALLLIDLDGFKQINDTFGHAAGDQCLKEFAARLSRLCAAADLVARIGGDEFAVLLGGRGRHMPVEDLAAAIVGGARQPIHCGGQSFQLGASVGIAVQAGPPGLACELFTNADTALYAAKAAGRNRFRLFAPAMKDQADRRLHTVRELSNALRDGQLEQHYQPQFELGDGTVRGFEALLRWRREDGDVREAATFAAALEDPELARGLGVWSLETALQQAQLWARAGLSFGHLAINVGSSHVNDPLFAETLTRRVAELGLRPEMIEIEVTESVFLRPDDGEIKRVLEQLKGHGFGLALDDFGTGYASLVHLRTYPVDTIKIDRSFVQGLLTSRHDGAIVEAILRLGSALGIEVIAEGVETAEQVERLVALGCRSVQGYFFAKAIPAAEAERYLRAAPIRSRQVA